MKFKEYKSLNLARVADNVLSQWDAEDTFRRSTAERPDAKPYIFYEGPPSANGVPGIHHVLSRTIKDAICRYKTQQGYRIERKAGWDTHGLPVELGVEKKLGITKEDIGTKISVEEYNLACREAVMEFTGVWENLTRMMGYWVDMSAPYITYDNKYIETLWYLLKQLFDKGLLYKGYTIQPYSPAAGTGLSTHELNQPGCYRDVKDTTLTAQFRVIRNGESEKLYERAKGEVYFLAWTTTPWTLPSNVALAVGTDIEYVKVYCKNPYSGEEQTIVMARDLVGSYFNEKTEYEIDNRSLKGSELIGIRYVEPMGDAFRVIAGDFVTTADGTGIVHIAPTFGADDDRAGKAAGVTPLFVVDKSGKTAPLVDRRGRLYPIDEMDSDFVRKYVNVPLYSAWAGRYVKNAYDDTLDKDAEPLDVELAVMLKASGKAFKIEKHVHSYPHCWRTDKPVLYYPLDSWFVRTTALKERLISLNKTINWKPESTGSGRFGRWLEGLVDWNLSRSRFWGTPLPIWATEEYSETKCIGSVEELRSEIDKSVAAGFMKSNPLSDFIMGDFSETNYAKFDLHRPYVDEIVLVSSKGEAMRRESDLIDVWFDSGAMPYAQVHYPFEVSDEEFRSKHFPADFIAEGVDQTRGWFFTLHAIASMLFDSVAFKNIISNGLVLDKSGNKMSKRLGNTIEPFETMEKYGADAVRWYMVSNSQPWDNLKFDVDGVDEVRRKFFGTLYNTYGFFALYANVDNIDTDVLNTPDKTHLAEIDRWILSLLNSLVVYVTERMEDYDITPAARAIADFVGENLSNWYVRLNRKRFWGGGMSEDKMAAYQTLHTCLKTISQLMAPFAPFFAEQLWRDLGGKDSVHLTAFPVADTSMIDTELEGQMDIAQRVSSMVLALRRKVNIKVRQPLSKMMIPILSDDMARHIASVEGLIRNEVNVKELELLTETTGLITKRIKPNFKTLGPRYGKQMKGIAALVAGFSQEDIARIEMEGGTQFVVDGVNVETTREDFEITSEDMPGWLVASEGGLTVALDITVTDELRREGIARELINRIQNIRKDSGFEVTDHIRIEIEKLELVESAVAEYSDYIGQQTLAESVILSEKPQGEFVINSDIDDLPIVIAVTKIV